GLRRMYELQEDIYYYITLMNEFYLMPPMPEGVKDGILKGMYRYKAATSENARSKVNLLGSGTILNEVIKAQETLQTKYGIAVDVWSVTSYKELYADAIETERWNRLHPQAEPRRPYVQDCFQGQDGVFVAASDYVKAIPCMISRWMPGRLISLGTDGFGRSDSRSALRDYFEVDWRFITLAALQGLAEQEKFDRAQVQKAIEDLEINPEKVSPLAI
ncbi:MAG: pyruvate dehydrogenase (acetyl-transferring), homodimeric type, partial [Phycisphaerales bacterium]